MKDYFAFVSWLFRALDATSAWLFILVFAAAALPRIPEIEGDLTTQSGRWWLELVEPGTWATIAVAVKGLGAPMVVRLRGALSPTYRFRQLAGCADELAAKLSDGKNYLANVGDFLLTNRTYPLLPTPHLETEIAKFKAKLDALDVCGTPPRNDVAGWQRAVPELMGLMTSGALEDARNHDWISDS